MDGVLMVSRFFSHKCLCMWRGLRYLFLKLQRIKDTPHRLALGLSCGIFASFTPLFGLHFIFAALLAWVVGANVVASLVGTGFGNPLTFPIIAPVSVSIGNGLMGFSGGPPNDPLEQTKALFMALYGWLFNTNTLSVAQTFKDFLYDVFWPYLIGGTIPGCVCALIIYFPIKAFVARRQARKIRRKDTTAETKLVAGSLGFSHRNASR